MADIKVFGEVGKQMFGVGLLFVVGVYIIVVLDKPRTLKGV